MSNRFGKPTSVLSGIAFGLAAFAWSLAAGAQELVLVGDQQGQAPANKPAASQPAEKAPAKGPAGGQQGEAQVPEARATITRARELERVATQQLRAQITASLAEARRHVTIDPDAAIELLKRELDRIEAATGVPETARESLRRQVRSALRQAYREKERLQMETVAKEERLARAQELKKLSDLLVERQQIQAQLMDQFNALMTELDHRAALLVARRMREFAPGQPLPEQATFVSETLANLDDQLELEEVRRHRRLVTWLQVDKSHIPFPDEPPIEYPDVEWWQEMSARRKKWAVVDLSSPSEAEQKIIEKLDEPITLEFMDTPLSDVIDFIREVTEVNIVVDRVALDDEGVTTDTPVTINVQNVPLRSALKLLLDPLNLTYLVRDDVLQITSQSEAGQELIHKVYPVADLVMPIGAGRGLAGGGGLFGGGLGGLGGLGGGFGGLGGGLGGLGGGLGGLGGGLGGLGGLGGGGLGGLGGFGGFGFRSVPVGPPPRRMSEDLKRLIERVVEPKQWDVNGGPGSIRYWQGNTSLVISQTQEVHEKIKDLLEQLRGMDCPAKQSSVNP